MDTKSIFPNTLIACVNKFADPKAALQAMVAMRWPNGVVCPHCGAENPAFLEKQQRWQCKNKHPHRQFSVKVGTIFEDSPIPLGKWLIAIWLIASAKNGISSYEIHRGIEVTQKTAWFMLHRIRLALKNGIFNKAGGIVEADEAFIGGKVGNFKKSKLRDLRTEAKAMKPGKQVNVGHIVKKAIIMGILERGQNGERSQMRTTIIESRRRPHIQDAVRQQVEPGSMLMTDTLSSYKGLQDTFIHMAINHALAYAKGNIHTNGLENFWALMKRTLEGTYVACEPFHLERYLDEQCFRFNNRKATDGERFVRALAGATGKRLTYAELTGKNVGVERTTEGPVC